ncbi:MAG: class I SAM-dependent methyltransferase [Alphaproteobacteria bacterium]|nr:class I SAM-dependent methyltransferase [Alphaproteobacteria bacterium]
MSPSSVFISRLLLYSRLGFPPAWIAGKRYFEIGPGSADAAGFFARFGPAQMVLADKDPSVVETLRARVAAGDFPCDDVRVVQAKLPDGSAEPVYDLVLAEGVFPGEDDPAALLRFAGDLCRPGGMVVATSISPISVFAESSRRLLKPILKSEGVADDDMVDEIVRIFGPDLDTMAGMRRPKSEWATHTLLLGWKNVTLTLNEMIETFGDRFMIGGTSPDFKTDWRWFKAPDVTPASVNRRAIEDYHRNVAAMLDYRVDPTGDIGVDGAALDRLAGLALATQMEAWHADSLAPIPRYLEIAREIADLIEPAMTETATGIQDFCAAIQRRLDHGPSSGLDTKRFRPMFGRGQLFVAFQKL